MPPNTKTLVYMLVAFAVGLALALMFTFHEGLFAKTDLEGPELRDRLQVLETTKTRAEILRARADLERSLLNLAPTEEAKRGVKESLDLFLHRLSRVELGRPRPFAVLGEENAAGIHGGAKR